MGSRAGAVKQLIVNGILSAMGNKPFCSDDADVPAIRQPSQYRDPRWVPMSFRRRRPRSIRDSTSGADRAALARRTPRCTLGAGPMNPAVACRVHVASPPSVLVSALRMLEEDGNDALFASASMR